MPFKHGKLTELWLDNFDVSQYFNTAAWAATIDTADTSTFKNTYRTFIEGVANSTLTASGFYDLTNDAAMAANIRDGGSVLTYFPAGCVAIGDLARLVSVHQTNMNESSPVGGAVLMDVAFQDDGVSGFGVGLHTLSTDTGTTTGATFDGTASTSTGWHAHLHVTAVTGAPTSWTIKLQDASASNFSDGADVTGGSFAATNVATSQRLAGAALTTTLRRYVRYVATVVGGTTPTITFGLAFSRN